MGFEQAWLAYKENKSYIDQAYFQAIYTNVEHKVIETATKELKEVAYATFGLEADILPLQQRSEKGIELILLRDGSIAKEGYRIKSSEDRITISACDENGILYGTFRLISLVQRNERIHELDIVESPSNPCRMLNHWDNMDGSIERGYSGESFFFKNGEILVDERTRFYARLIASVGINATVINNVNVKDYATKLIDKTYDQPLREMATIFEEFGIKLYLSLNFAAPMELGELDSSDPLDEQVRQWWEEKMKDIFSRIPNLGGFLVKADSEGRPGPFTYNRTHADGANMLAEAVKPYGGTIIWRCFVYNCQQDWRDRKTDRARAGYDHFKPLDGTFHDNVVLQIKNGPMDFQVREPISPLLGGLEHTNQILEFQIAQEYTGQQKHVCYLMPMFEQVLNFKTYCKAEDDLVKDIISGKTFGQTICGMAAVVNTGNDVNWTGHDLAASNLFGFGRLSFNTSLTAEEIAAEWIQLTYGLEELVKNNIHQMLMSSWAAYEKYTSPLGIGWMVNPNHHYGPNVDGYEYDRWGTYHRADHKGIGVDRSEFGTGYALQYRKENATIYNDITTCPEELILFFHHIPYTYCLQSGKTVIQHIYDTHFEGVEDVETMSQLWNELEGKVPQLVFLRVRRRLDHQIDHAKEWRDQVNSYFYRKSFIEDKKGRLIY